MQPDDSTPHSVGALRNDSVALGDLGFGIMNEGVYDVVHKEGERDDAREDAKGGREADRDNLRASDAVKGGAAWVHQHVGGHHAPQHGADALDGDKDDRVPHKQEAHRVDAHKDLQVLEQRHWVDDLVTGNGGPCHDGVTTNGALCGTATHHSPGAQGLHTVVASAAAASWRGTLHPRRGRLCTAPAA